MSTLDELEDIIGEPAARRMPPLYGSFADKSAQSRRRGSKRSLGRQTKAAKTPLIERETDGIPDLRSPTPR